jgi:hypothetical protein
MDGWVGVDVRDRCAVVLLFCTTISYPMATAAHCEKETNYLFNLAKLEKLQAKHTRIPNQSSGFELKKKATHQPKLQHLISLSQGSRSKQDRVQG